MGHYASECRKEKREPGSCYICGKFDHHASDCLLNKKKANLNLGDSGYEKDTYVRFLKLNIINDNNLELFTECTIDSASDISAIKKSILSNTVELNPSYVSPIFGINKSKVKTYGKVSCFIQALDFQIVFDLEVVADETMGPSVLLGKNFLWACFVRLVSDIPSVNKLLNGPNTKVIDKILCYEENDKNDSTILKEKTNDRKTEDVSTDTVKNEENTGRSKNLCNEKRNNINFRNEQIEKITSERKNNVIDANETFEFAILALNCEKLHENQKSYKINENLKFEYNKRFEKVFDEHYLKNLRPDNPKIKTEMKLVVEKPKPFSCAPRRLSYAEKNALEKILDDYLEKGYIRPSESEFVSPIVMTKKKTGEFRMCSDYRKLNSMTAKDSYPIPIIDDLLDKLCDKKLFSKLDLKNGFHHVYMHEDSIKFTSFTTPFGQFEYLRMPFGLKNAPSVFQRFINKIFSDLIKENKVIVYLDDIMIATKTIEEHFEILEEIFKRLVDNKLELRLDKCEFFQENIKYLGYVISKDGIEADNKGLEAIQMFPVPSNLHAVQSFLGLCQYFRRFIKDFSVIAKPLYDLTKKDKKFNFGTAELETFELLKAKLLNAPILALFNPKDETELHCDASALGFGAILLQRKDDKKFHPIFYYSKRTSEVESKYHSFELETLAIIYALKRFRVYLQGRKFKIVTDCNSLTMTLNKKEMNPRIARWALELQNYDYTLEHRSNKRMQHVDALSRNTNMLVIETNTFEENLIICQSQDERLRGIKELLEKSEHNLYEMRNGVIYRKKDGTILFYVPEAMESHVLYKYHNEMGHIGLEKMHDVISKTYWFPNVRKKCEEHIKNCLECIAFSEKSGKCEGLINSIPKGNVPFETLHIDHYGPIDKEKTKKHVLVVIDAMTKFTRLYPTKTTNSKEAIKALSEYFRAYSRPKTLISDRGTCFTSNEFKQFVESNNIKHIKIATGSPQANGQVERVNRSLGQMIAKASASDKSLSLDNILENIEFAMNNSQHRALKEHPSVVLFGIAQKGKILDTLKENVVEQNQIIDRNLERVRDNVQVKQKKLQEYNESNANKKRKESKKYKEGDLVMIRNFDSHVGASRKLIPRFRGPYQISKVLRNDRYLIVDTENFQQSRAPYKGVWAVSNMKPWLKGRDSSKSVDRIT